LIKRPVATQCDDAFDADLQLRAANGADPQSSRNALPACQGKRQERYLRLPAEAAGRPGIAANGDTAAVTFVLFCFGFFGSRPLRF
jgi:hypothetical protein